MLITVGFFSQTIRYLVTINIFANLISDSTHDYLFLMELQITLYGNDLSAL